MTSTTETRTRVSDAQRLASLHTAKTGRAQLNKTEAAAFLGLSVDSFDCHIEGDIRVVRIGRLRLYSVLELYRWMDRTAEQVAA